VWPVSKLVRAIPFCIADNQVWLTYFVTDIAVLKFRKLAAVIQLTGVVLSGGCQMMLVTVQEY